MEQLIPSVTNLQNVDRMIGDILPTNLKCTNVQQITCSLKLEEPCISVIRVNITTLGLPNSIVAENREILKIIFDVLIYLARQNSAFRGHNESWSSKNQGNFLELLKLMSKHNALLKSHLSKITNAKKSYNISLQRQSKYNVKCTW